LLTALVTISFPAWAAAPDIILPEPLAIELPEGVTSLGADDPALRELTARARAEGNRLSVTLAGDRIGVGVWRVIWSAWDAEANNPVARRASYLFILPHGMTPVGTSGGTNATAGNNTTHIVRDPSGAVHMVWYDSWRPLAHEGAQYRRARVNRDGTIRFETDTIPLGLHNGNRSAMPTLASFGDTIHFAWQAEGTLRYRSLTRDRDNWRWSDEVDTKIPSPGRDTGPSIAVDASGVHILTTAAIYATTSDGGRTWTTEPVPFGSDQHVKTVSLTFDNAGHALAAASSVVIDPPKYSEDVGHGAYWTVRLSRRIAPGVWQSVPGPVDGRPEWAAPGNADQDVLCDWVRVREDRTGGIHVTWHGTAVSRIYGNDRAYYAWRSPEGEWHAPVTLWEADPKRGYGWSYAPGLILDGDRALTLDFHRVYVGHDERGFDSEFELFRDGKSLAPPLPVTRFAEQSVITGKPENALSAWFPGAAPSLVRDGGRVWADVLVSLAPTGVKAPSLIVWIRPELTDWLKAVGQ
jgi:hypothetical protein